VLPLYVLFKGEYLYDNWTRNGPQNCRYNVTKNGWMDKLQLSQHSFRHSRSNIPRPQSQSNMNRSLMRSRSSSRESSRKAEKEWEINKKLDAKAKKEETKLKKQELT